MASTHLSAAELLALEDRQIGFYLADVRALDTHTADLYPVPQLLYTACIALAAQLPWVIGQIVARVGSPEAFALRLRRVLSPATAQDIAGAGLIATWGREMARLDQADVPGLTEQGCAEVLRFAYEVARHYRADGEPHPDDAAGLGSNYRILRQTEAQALAQRCEPLTPAQASDLLGLTSAMRALSFLMQAQIREAVMMHGPYPTGARGVELIVVECADLHGARMAGEDAPQAAPLDLDSLAIAMLVRDGEISADRFGTLHARRWEARNLVAAALLTRGRDALADEGLHEVAIGRAGALRGQFESADAVQRQRIAGWAPSRRMAAGIAIAHALLCRLLTAAGLSRDELARSQHQVRQFSAPIVARHLARNAGCTQAQLPFFAKLRRYVDGAEPRLFTPFGFP